MRSSLSLCLCVRRVAAALCVGLVKQMTKQPPPTLIVDNREPPQMAQLLRGLGLTATVIEALVGDYIWQSPLGVVMVERKTVNDLLASVGDGRLHRQLTTMTELAKVPILLVEGELSQYDGHMDAWRGKEAQKDWNFNAVMNLMLSWQLGGIYVTSSPGLSYTHLRIQSLYNWSQKNSHLRPKRKKQIPAMGRLSLRAEVLAAIPRIGVETAMVLAQGNSLKQLFSKTEEEWQKLLGLKDGATVARFIEERQ